MLSIGVSEFRANINRVLQQVQNGEIVSLLLRGKEIARIVPPDYAQTAARQELEALRQDAVVGDVLAPIDERWQAAGES
jgi:antitoxin (DNA-binding transcriptional repressor) of toxin-antitoxin stability system